jgi:hypothetical protein
MRVILAVLVLVAAPTAFAGSIPSPAVLPKPGFPPPAGNVNGGEPQLVIVSLRNRDPGTLPPDGPAPPAWAPNAYRGAQLDAAIRQQGKVFLIYGGRYLVGATARSQALRYAFDFGTFTRPPNGGDFEPVTWAREMDGVLYASNSHLTYATATRKRNAYLSAIDVETRRTLWRSPALVANARTFVVAGDLIVAGYGVHRRAGLPLPAGSPHRQRARPASRAERARDHQAAR